MYVCVCNAITEEQLRRAIADGARTLDDLREALGLGDQCGKCLEEEDMHRYLCEEAPEAPSDESLPPAAAER